MVLSNCEGRNERVQNNYSFLFLLIKEAKMILFSVYFCDSIIFILNKTLIILCQGFAANMQDTTCLPAHQVFVKALNRNFPSLRIIILAFQYPLCSKEYKWFGNDIISFNGADEGKFSRLLLWWRIHRRLRKLKKQTNIIGLLSFWCSECALIGKKFAKRNYLKHIIWITGQDAKKNSKYVKWIKPSSNELVAMSDFLADTFYKNHGVKPAYVIPNGIDKEMFDKVQVVKNIDILAAGSLIPLKQYNVFVEAIAAIKKVIPSVNAMLCGAGPEEQKLKEMIRQYKLEKNLSLTGKKQHGEVLQLMQQAKIFLHPSSYEGFSTVCLEALYGGAHVISFVKPMNHSIKNWHIVNSKEEMIKKTISLLTKSNIQYTPVLLYSMDENAKAMMKLFGIISE